MPDLLARTVRGLLSALTRSLRGMQQSLLIQTVAILTFALMLLLCGVVRLCAHNAGRLIQHLGRGVEMIVYLRDGVSPARSHQIAEVLRKLPGVTTVREVSAREARERLRQGLGDHGDLMEGLEEDLFPASIEVSFKSGISDVLRVHPLYTRLRSTEGVEDIELMTEWVRRLLLAQRLLWVLFISLGTLMSLSCLYVVAATIRLGVYARRDEIDVLRLVGATNLHVKAPFLIEGALQGMLGASLSIMALFGLYELAIGPVQALVSELFGDARLSFLPAIELLGAIGLGGLLGLLGSGMAISRHVRP